jgi:biopolymer transport protein ExbD
MAEAEAEETQELLEALALAVELALVEMVETILVTLVIMELATVQVAVAEDVTLPTAVTT